MQVFLLFDDLLDLFFVAFFDLALVALHLVLSDLALVVVVEPLADVPRLRERVHRDDSEIIANQKLLLPSVLIFVLLLTLSNSVLVFASVVL